MASYMYLNVDGPLQASGHPEGFSRVGVLDVAENEEIEEEPANHLHQLVVPLPLLLINHVLDKEQININIHCTLEARLQQFKVIFVV